MQNPFRHVITDFGYCPFGSQGPGNRHGAAAVLLSVMADHFDEHPVEVTETNPYRFVFAALAKYEDSPFVRQLRQDLNHKVER
jgi:hypothetical protein